MNEEICVEILLVEDNKKDAELILRILEEHNLSHHVVWLKNGKEALDFVFSKGQYAGLDVANQLKIILLDLKMPKVGGLEVFKRVRAYQKTRKVPVTILTSSRGEKSIIESYNLGVDSYIVKPVDPGQLMKSIKDIPLLLEPIY